MKEQENSDSVVEMEQEEEEEEEKAADHPSAIKEEHQEEKEEDEEEEDVDESAKKKPFSRTAASSIKLVETAGQNIERKKDIKQEKHTRNDAIGTGTKTGTSILPKEEKKKKRQSLRKWSSFIFFDLY